MTLNGVLLPVPLAQCHLWGGHSLPLFMVHVGLHCRDIHTRCHRHRRILKGMDNFFFHSDPGLVHLGGCQPVREKYAIAIRLATALVGSCIGYFHNVASRFSRVAAARFIAIGFHRPVIGILVMSQDLRALPRCFITEWGVQIGSTLVVLSCPGPRRTRSRNAQGVENTADRACRRTRRPRASASSWKVSSGPRPGISGEFLSVSDKLQAITNRFFDLSMEQAATAEEMSSTFEACRRPLRIYPVDDQPEERGREIDAAGGRPERGAERG